MIDFIKLRLRIVLVVLCVCVSNSALAAESGSSGEGGSAAADHHAVDYNKPPLNPEPLLLIFSFVFFGLFVLGMRSNVWNPLIKNLNLREERVVKATADAQAARQDVERLAAQVEQRLAEAHDQVATILAQARNDAEARKLEIIAQAEQESQRIKEDALAQIAKARQSALQELDETVDRQASLAMEHVAGRNF